jgi:hypothetical protein
MAANVAKRKAGVVEDEDYAAAKKELGSFGEENSGKG